MPGDFSPPAIPGFTVIVGNNPSKDESEVRIALRAGSYGVEGADPVPCNIVLKTTESRIPAWVTAISEVFKEEDWQWTQLSGCDSGQQCKVRNVTINIYDKGSIMIQGAKCVEFAREHLLKIKEEVDRQCVPMKVVGSGIQAANDSPMPNVMDSQGQDDSIEFSQGFGDLTLTSSPEPQASSNEIMKGKCCITDMIETSVQCDPVTMSENSVQCETINMTESSVQCEEIPSNQIAILKYLQAIEERVASLSREVGTIKSLAEGNTSSIKTLNTNVQKVNDIIPDIKGISAAVKDLNDNLPKSDWYSKVATEEKESNVQSDLQKISGSLKKVVQNTELLPKVRDTVERNEEHLKEVKPAVKITRNKVQDTVVPLITEMPEKISNNIQSAVTEIKETIKQKETKRKYSEVASDKRSTDTDQNMPRNEIPKSEKEGGTSSAPDHDGAQSREASDSDLNDYVPVTRRHPLHKPKIVILHDSLMDKVDQNRLFGNAAIPCMRKCGTLQNAVRCVKDSIDEIASADFNVVHLSINDLKGHPVNDVVELTVELTEEIKKCSTKPIILSKPLPVGESHGDLDSCVARYCNRIQKVFEKDNQVFLVENDSFSPNGYLQTRLYEDDQLHLNMNGTKKLVFHIKKVLGQWIPAVRPQALRRGQENVYRPQSMSRLDDQRFGRGTRGWKSKTQYQQPNGFEDMNPFQLLSGLSTLVKMFN